MNGYNYPSAPPSRQISNTSAGTTNSTSNWESYPSEDDEEDATEAYYAKLRAARSKRATPEDGYVPPGGQIKKARGIPPYHDGRIYMTDAHGNRIVSGSEANWTDEDAF
jgi:protein regulator of cytokinesis 1